MKRICVHEELCMGCGLCEVSCTVQHSRSHDFIKAFRMESPKPISRVRLVREDTVSFAVQCRHCDDAPCVSACLSGAMYIDEKTGAIMHDDERCMHCLTCIMVCRMGAIRMGPLGQKAIVKCDLCNGSELPACVSNCPNNALTFEDVTLS